MLGTIDQFCHVSPPILTLGWEAIVFINHKASFITKLISFLASPDSHLANLKNIVCLYEQLRLVSRIPNAGKDIEVGLPYVAGKKWYNSLENSLVVPYKLNLDWQYDWKMPFLGVSLLKRNQITCTYKDLYSNNHSNFIHDNPELDQKKKKKCPSTGK